MSEYQINHCPDVELTKLPNDDIRTHDGHVLRLGDVVYFRFTPMPAAAEYVVVSDRALGVNGGYVVASDTIIGYLRETSPFYIYSNPITPGEAGAALAAVEIVDSPHGCQRLDRLRAMTARFREGLTRMGLETVAGQHPVVPLMVRDTDRTARLVAHLRANGILATGLGYPIVPKGDDEIRFQMCADHTPADIDEALGALEQFSG